MGFPRWTRIEIFNRDHKTCVQCERKWEDGWFLQCAHYEDGKGPPRANDAKAGRLLCVECHTKEHTTFLKWAEERGDFAEIQRHSKAIRLLSLTSPRRIFNLPLFV